MMILILLWDLDYIISEYLNKTFDWDGAMRDVSGRNLSQVRLNII